MNDCIDRRTGGGLTSVCDDANRAYREARDEAGWRSAAKAAMRVAEHLNRDQRRITRGKEWADQATDCLERAAQYATKGDNRCPESH